MSFQESPDLNELIREGYQREAALLRRVDVAEARQQALVNRVAVLERALEQIAYANPDPSAFAITKAKMIAREALDAS